MDEKMWDYHENSDNISTSQEAKNWTEKSKDSKLNGIFHKLNDEEKKRPSNDKLKEIQKLQNLLIRWEYNQFQKKIWLTNCDWRLWGETLDKLEKFLTLSNHQEYIPITNNSKWETEQRKDEKEAEEKLSRYINGDKTSDVSLNRETPWTNTTTQDTGPTLLSFWNDKRSIEQWIFHERPRLWILWKKLEFDWTSKLSFIKPHLNDLNTMPESSLLKLKKVVKGICISDKPVTSRKANKSLLWVTPRWHPSNSSWNTVWGCLRGNVVYAWRAMRPDWSYYSHKEVYGNNDKESSDSLILHEIGHAFDYKYEVSTRPSFKMFHKRFFNKLWTYFQQWWEWSSVWCEEFFAEASAEFHKWWEEAFSKYYSKDFYDYMKNILC